MNLPAVVNDSRKFEAFKRFGQFNDARAREVLSKSSYTPVLEVDNLNRYGPRVWGYYPMNGDTVLLHIVIARQYEKLHQRWLTASAMRGGDTRWRSIIKRAELAIESTILHEMVHWGDITDSKDGLSQLREAVGRGWDDVGHEFVNKAYGKQIGFERTTKGRQKIPVRQNVLTVENWIGWDKKGRPFNL